MIRSSACPSLVSLGAIAMPFDPLGSRGTLTLPVLNNARNVIFVTAGEAKAPLLRQVLEPDTEEKALPAARVSPCDGALQWFVDADAAEELDETHYEIC